MKNSTGGAGKMGGWVVNSWTCIACTDAGIKCLQNGN